MQELLDKPALAAPTYASNDPVNRIDPSGKKSFTATMKLGKICWAEAECDFVYGSFTRDFNVKNTGYDIRLKFITCRGTGGYEEVNTKLRRVKNNLPDETVASTTHTVCYPAGSTEKYDPSTKGNHHIDIELRHPYYTGEDTVTIKYRVTYK